jgi:ArsR family transcriptional regulator
VLSGSPLFRLLGDDARLRILRLLAAERLNVSELTGILGLAQSGVSRHLGMLKDAGLIAEQREGIYTWYRLAPSLQQADNGFGPLWPLLQAHFEQTAGTADGRADAARLEEVRRLRKENFDQHSGPDARERQLVPGRSWAAWARALGHLLPAWRVADLGCGDGYLTIEASRWASRVVAIDRSRPVLERARALARRRGVRNITWRQGEIERVPLRDGSVDLAILSQALHHAADPAAAAAEAARIVAPGGRVLVLDLREHDQEWVTARLGDRWRGFSDATLARLLKQAGLSDVNITVGARRAGDPFTVLVGSGVKRAAARTRTSR